MLKWISSHKVLMIVFSVILVLCIIISISYTRGNLGIISGGVQTANSAVQKPLSKGVERFKKDVNGIIGFKSVVAENEALKDEIAELRNENIKLALSEQELAELRELYGALNYIPEDSGLTPVAANIVALDGSNYYNIFTIDRGTESGVIAESIVISGEGLVGKVIDAGHGYAKVVSIIDDGTNVSFRVVRNLEIMGIVSGDGKSRLSGYTFDADADLNEGDVIITSGLGLYPEGIVIGTIDTVLFNQDTQLRTVTATPAVDFNSLKKVMVLI